MGDERMTDGQVVDAFLTVFDTDLRTGDAEWQTTLRDLRRRLVEAVAEARAILEED